MIWSDHAPFVKVFCRATALGLWNLMYSARNCTKLRWNAILFQRHSTRHL